MMQAESDLGAAKELLSKYPSQCLWLCQQATEKALKAVILRAGTRAVGGLITHSLREINSAVGRQEKEYLNKMLGTGTLNKVQKHFDSLVPPGRSDQKTANVRYPFGAGAESAAPCSYPKYINSKFVSGAVMMADRILNVARYMT